MSTTISCMLGDGAFWMSGIGAEQGGRLTDSNANGMNLSYNQFVTSVPADRCPDVR
jgi:hypothetical protein